ncbi:MAG: hypothetical protein HY611_01170 [Elusimicrobia bacterium]|nr:hypothetical protein [Elusimicrobiota bacterium]
MTRLYDRPRAVEPLKNPHTTALSCAAMARSWQIQPNHEALFAIRGAVA